MNAWVAKTQKNKVVVVGGVRTPFAKAGTKLKDCGAVHLGVAAATEAMAQADVSPDKIDEVAFGNAGTPADAANISRVIALRAGIPESVPAYTVHRNCASAMEALAQGCLKIGAGLADCMLVGGTESMSNMPLMYGDQMKELFGALTFAKSVSEKAQRVSEFRPSWLKPIVAVMEGLTDPISGLNMGQTAEILARDFGISREEQDRFALRSHQRAAAAAPKLALETIPVILEPDYDSYLGTDVGPRANQTMEALAKLKPFFDRDNGTVTAGNACPITDGAAALVLMSEARAKSEGREILGAISGYSFAGLDPKRMGMGPIHATSLLLEATGLPWNEIQLVELNEAFAAQVLANQKAFESKKYCSEKLGRAREIGVLSDEILNVNGGGIALGHPVGATGARLVLTALKEMRRSGKHQGLATLCIGGGQGAAFLLEA